MRVVLASKSPRRKELLGKNFSEFEIASLEVDESLPRCLDVIFGVELLAIKKGEAVAKTFPLDTLVISSDTLVELSGVPLGKPKDEQDALNMLLSLSDKVHNVHTGVAIHYKGRVYSGVDTSKVEFRKIEREDAIDYIKSGEPMDKAGAYAIQGLGGKFVRRYRGEFNTIVGLSLKLTKKLIKKALSDDKG